MPKILIYSQDLSDVETVVTPLKDVGYIVSHIQNFETLFKEASDFSADIVILALKENMDETSRICRKIRLLDQSSDVQIILLLNENPSFNDISQGADGYISRPINTALLVSTVNAHLRLKNHLDIFSANNSELAKRFYQLKVLYDTNSKLAGTLNRRKLINIMNEGLEQSISYSLCSTLIINNPEDILLQVNSLYPITKRLEQALKLRAVITYKSMFPDDELPFDFNVNNIKTEINYKKDEEQYDLEVMSFASIFAPLSTQDKFFGTVEIMRDTELSREDTTCFQTVVSQVALPLESAILYEEIQEKNIKLEKLEKLKSEFVSIVSHELRTPLTAIKNALDIMLTGKTGEINDKMANFLNMGKRNVVRLAGIINDLLDLSKIEAGKMEYHFEKTNLKDPINNVLATFKPTAQEKEIEFTSRFDVEDAFVYADSPKIEQVLSNLVSNALKFTNAKGKVEIILEEKDEKNYRVLVADTGIGINQDNISKVFDKFQQIESSLSRKVGGTGLGLPIAKEFVLAHKGNVGVQSEENKGTTFSFILPKYNEKMNFLIEIELFYERAKNSNANFAIVSLGNKEEIILDDFFAKDKKCKKIFNFADVTYALLQLPNKNAFEIYLEKLKDFLISKNNDKILLKSAYCDFDEGAELPSILDELDKG